MLLPPRFATVESVHLLALCCVCVCVVSICLCVGVYVCARACEILEQLSLVLVMKNCRAHKDSIIKP